MTTNIADNLDFALHTRLHEIIVRRMKGYHLKEIFVEATGISQRRVAVSQGFTPCNSYQIFSDNEIKKTGKKPFTDNMEPELLRVTSKEVLMRSKDELLMVFQYFAKNEAKNNWRFTSAEQIVIETAIEREMTIDDLSIALNKSPDTIKTLRRNIKRKIGDSSIYSDDERNWWRPFINYVSRNIQEIRPHC